MKFSFVLASTLYAFADVRDAELMRWAQQYRRTNGHNFTLSKIVVEDSSPWPVKTVNVFECGGAHAITQP